MCAPCAQYCCWASDCASPARLLHRIRGRASCKRRPGHGWPISLKQVRPPLGALSQRGLLATQFRRSIPGAADGDYAIVVFRTTFAKKMDARETLTLEREPDGVWRVIGYFIR